MTDFTMETMFPEVLSSTQDIEVFTSCQYKWFIKRCGKWSKRAYNVNLEAGKEFAKAMELTRVAFYKDGKTEQEAIDIGLNHILTEYAKSYASQEYPDDLKTPEKMAEVFRQMFTLNPMEDLDIVPFVMEDGTLSVEQDLSIELPIDHPETGKPIVLKCKLDMLGIRDGRVFVQDEKTAKSVLKDQIKQTNLLRTSNQFVQYAAVANKSDLLPPELTVTHIRINKCIIKKRYAKDDQVVVPYEFAVDLWFQAEWWQNLLHIVNDMVTKYKHFKYMAEFGSKEKVIDIANNHLVVFPRAYGHGCTTFFSPCQLTDHCTSGNYQSLGEQGFRQVVCDSRTGYKDVPLLEYKRNKGLADG